MARIELEKSSKEVDESNLEYLYDYYDYPEDSRVEYDESKDDDWSTVIKIDL